MFPEAAAKLKSGQWTIQKKCGKNVKSSAWTKFSEIVDEETKEYVGFVQCISCKQICKHKKGTRPFWLSKHACVSNSPIEEVKPEDKKKFRDACVGMCTGDMRSFSTFTGPYFTKIVQVAIDVGAKAGQVDAETLVCDRTTISRMIAKRAMKAKSVLYPKILETIIDGRAAATTDFWTENYTKKHFM